MTGTTPWEHATKLLCVRLDSIGDVLMTTPALRALKETAPNRSLTLLTSPRGAEAARLVPEVDDVIVYDAPWMKETAPRGDSRPDRAMIETLRHRGFDAAVIFTVYTQNPLPAALLCYLADIPLRLAHCRENPYQLLTDWVREIEPDHTTRHEVSRQLDLVACVGARTRDERLSVSPPEAGRKRALRMLEDRRLNPERPWVVIHPGASAPSRRYPPESFARVAHLLTVNHGWQVVFTGSEQERPLIEGIRAAMEAPSHSLAGRLNLGELAALLELAPLLISNNTSPVHLAAAAGTPVVDLYALTNPQHGPWKTPNRVLSHHVPCQNCYRSVCPEGHHNCLRLISPEAVVAAATDLLREVGMGHSATPALAGSSDGFRVTPWFRHVSEDALPIIGGGGR